MGYSETDARGEEVEDWEIENNLFLVNTPEDWPCFYSRTWHSSSTPDLAFATSDLAYKTERAVGEQLGTSDHRPVKLSIDLEYAPEVSVPLPRWNYKRADWAKFAKLTDKYCGPITTHRKKSDL